MHQKILYVFVLVLIMIVNRSFAQNGNNLFNDSILHRIEFSGTDISQISNPYYKGIYQSVEMKIDGNVVNQVGLTTKGEKSYLAAPNDKKPFKIKIDKYISGQKYDGIKRFNLHNNTYDKGIMREKLTCDASLALGIPSPRIAFAEVYINDNYWGIYTLVEAQDEIYKRTFSDNNGYAMESFGSASNIDNMAYFGSIPEDYAGQYIVDHGEEATAWSYWINMLYKVNTFPARVAYVDSVSKYIDYQSYFKFNAVLDYNLNAEPKNRNGIYYYDITKKKWITICWDQNVSFPDFGDPNQSLFPNTKMTGFLDKYSTYNQFSEVYDGTLCQLANLIFTDEAVNSKVMRYRRIIDKAVERDTRKGFTYQQYEQSLLDLRNFIDTRNNVTRKFLNDKNYSCETTGLNPDIQESGIRIYPIPATDYLNITTPDNQRFDYAITSIQGSLILKGEINNSQINVSSFPPGVFVLEIFFGNKRLIVQKIIKK